MDESVFTRPKKPKEVEQGVRPLLAHHQALCVTIFLFVILFVLLLLQDIFVQLVYLHRQKDIIMITKAAYAETFTL